jgi:hypothetical protein
MPLPFTGLNWLKQASAIAIKVTVATYPFAENPFVSFIENSINVISS